MRGVDKVGNLPVKWAAREAERFGFPHLLGGMYHWRDYRASGSEIYLHDSSVDELKARTVGAFGKTLGEVELPEGTWYCQATDTLMVCVSENFGQGQSSRLYFGR